MIRRDLPAILQDCLDRIEAGETAEHCLASFPDQRRELEPLLRQALRLRIAFASAPSEALLRRAEASLLFSTGADVKAAFANPPDPAFVEQTRRRLLNSAGADAQEALRAVPPPRLAFWMNARRRLIAAAQTPPAPRRAPMAPVLALRLGVSAALVVLALALGGLGYMITQVEGPPPATEFASLGSDLRAIELKIQSGEVPPASAFQELSERTANLAEHDPLAVQELIDRQKLLVSQAQELDPSLSAAPEIQFAEQQLTDTETRLAAARAATPTASGAGSLPPPPTSTPPPPTATPLPLEEGQLRISALASDTTVTSLNDLWFLLESTEFSVAIPAGAEWTLVNVTTGTQDGEFIRMAGPRSTILFVDVLTGQMNAIVGEDNIVLQTADGIQIDYNELIVRAGPELAPVFIHMLETAELAAAAADPLNDGLPPE
jgi:hypothetical protein